MRLVREALRRLRLQARARALHQLLHVDLSAFYFDIRKDALYCDAPPAVRRAARRTVLGHLFDCLTAWLAPILLLHHGGGLARASPGRGASRCISSTSPKCPPTGATTALAAKWRKVRAVRRVVTGALEIERAEKRIGSSLEAAPDGPCCRPDAEGALEGLDFAEICITSGLDFGGVAAGGRFCPRRRGGGGGDDRQGAGIAAWTKCARSWRYTDDVGSDREYPDVSARDAAALRELRALGRL